jgi:hypothetical protein
MNSGTLVTEPISFSIRQHRLVGAAVQRAVERRRRAGHRRVRIDMRAPIVRIVVVLQFCSWSAWRMNRHVERARQHRVRLVLQLGHLEQHVQEVAGEAEVVVGIDVGAADAVAVGPGGDARHLGDQPSGLTQPRRLLEDVLRVRVEAGHRADGAEEDRHRVRVVLEALHQLLDVLVEHRVQVISRSTPAAATRSAARRTGSGRRSRGKSLSSASCSIG